MAETAIRADQAEWSGNIRMSERRLVGRALACWDEQRGGKRFPSRVNFDALIKQKMNGNTFLVAIGDTEDTDRVVESGDALIEALRTDPIGKKVIDVLPSSTERGLSFCRAAAELQKPIADVGHFTNADGEDIYYRSVLLPLSDDQETVNYLLGAFSFKRAI